EIEAFGERIVAAMVDHSIDLGNNRRLRKPFRNMNVRRYFRILIDVVADIDESPDRHLAERRNDALEEVDVARPEGTVRNVDQRLVIVQRELGDFVRLVLAHAALKILKLLRRQLVAALELHRCWIEQEIHERRRFEKLADRIALFADTVEERVEAVVNG